jgi:hypothetical protein
MRTTLFILCLSFFLSLNAQQPFAPLGAKWYYTPHCLGPENCEYFSFEAVSDTLIDGQLVRKIVNTRHTVAGNEIVPEATLFMYGDGDRVYFYYENEFRVLYDFSAAVGDTLDIIIGPFANFYQIGAGNSISETHSLQVRVESAGTTTIQEENLRTIQYSDILEDVPEPIWGFGWNSSNEDNIIERIGNTSSGLFGESLTQILAGSPGTFRCYEDSSFFYQNPDYNLPCDYLPVSSTKALRHSSFEVFPNPAKESITIINQSPSSELLSIQIMSMEGKIVLENVRTTFPEEIMTLNVSNLKAGIYLLKISRKENVFVQKIIINGR